MTIFTQSVHYNIAMLATATLFFHAGICAGQVRAPRQLPVAPIQMAPSPPNAVSVIEAAARSLPLTATAPPPLLNAQIIPLIQSINAQCFPANPTYSPYWLMPRAGFSSSPTTPFPQATWIPNPTPSSGTINYVIHRAVIGTTNWSLVASTCGGTPSIWNISVSAAGEVRPTIPAIMFADATGGLQPSTTYVYKVTAIDQNNRTDWGSFQWTSQPALPTIQISNYQRSGRIISFTAAQFYNVAGQMVDPAFQLVVQPENSPAFTEGGGSNFYCNLGSYGLVCPVQLNSKQTGVELTFQWGLRLQDGFHVYAQSGIKMPTP
jgi:hypothetical protein